MGSDIQTLRDHVRERLVGLSPGLGMAALVGLVAVGIESAERSVLGQPVIEGLVVAIIVGMVLRNLLHLPARMEAGVSFAAKEMLELGVLLLGVTIDARQVLAAGPALLLAIAVVVVGGIVFSYGLGRVLGLHSKLAMLVAVGNSICGNSAIACVAPVIRSDKKDVVSSISLTAIIGVVVVLSLPLLVPLAHLSHYQYGVLAGMTVYAVPQVVAASFPVSQLSGEVATLVKLLRVLFLAPVVLFFSLATGNRKGQGAIVADRPSLVPWFIVGFLLLMALRSVGVVPQIGVTVAHEASRLLTVLAMAGLGLGVDSTVLKKSGPRVAVAASGSLVFLILLSLLLIFGFRVGA